MAGLVGEAAEADSDGCWGLAGRWLMQSVGCLDIKHPRRCPIRESIHIRKGWCADASDLLCWFMMFFGLRR